MDSTEIIVQCLHCEELNYANVSNPLQTLFCDECEKPFLFQEGLKKYQDSQAEPFDGYSTLEVPESVIVEEFPKTSEPEDSLSQSMKKTVEIYHSFEEASVLNSNFSLFEEEKGFSVSEESVVIDSDLKGPQKSLLSHLASHHIVPETSSFLKGRIEPEKYTKLKEIARGGMGEVDLVKDNDLVREVARKRILSHHKKKGRVQSLIRFIDEAQTTGKLEHPNIIPIHEIGLDSKGQLYFTMKYIEGVTLQKIFSQLKKQEPTIKTEYSLLRLLQIFLQLCNALRFAHDKKIIHRDLKPENIMLGSFGEVILMDWGLAKNLEQNYSWDAEETLVLAENQLGDLKQQTGRQTLAGTILGTPPYMSPEQARGEIESVDYQSDVYGLGAILYETLCLEPPFTGINNDEILEDVIHTDPEPPARVGPLLHKRTVPQELSAIAMKAMAKEKMGRYPSVKALENDIQRYLEGKSVSALPDSLWKKGKRFFYRNATKVQGVALFTLLLFISLVGYRKYTKTQQIKNFMEKGNSLIRQARQNRDKAEDVLKQESSTKLKHMTLDEKEKYRQALRRKLTYFSKVQNFNSTQDIYQERLKEYQDALMKAAEEFRKVFDLEKKHPQAQEKLVEIYFERWEEALQKNNQEMMKEFENEIRIYLGEEAYEKSSHQKKIEGLRSLRIFSEPLEAEVYLFRLLPIGDFLLPYPYTLKQKEIDPAMLRKWSNSKKKANFPFTLTFSESLGKTNSDGLSLKGIAPGSYLLILKKANFLTMRIPLLLEHPLLKNSFFRYPKEKELEFSYKLLSKHRVADGFTYIPFLPFIYGDLKLGADEKQLKKAGDFFLKTQEVSLGEYADFLGDWYFQDKNLTELQQYIPRDFSPDAEEKKLLLQFDQESYRFVPTPHCLNNWPDTQTNWEKTPVRGITYRQVKTYLKWLNKKKERVLFRCPAEKTFLFELAKKRFPKNLWSKLEKILQPKNIKLAPQMSPQLFLTTKLQDSQWLLKDQENFRNYLIEFEKETATLIFYLNGFRLPTEEEWELAARGVDGRDYSWGKSFLPGYAKLTQGYGGISKEEIQQQYQKRQFKDKSIFGIEDLAGSVSEWVEGSFDPKERESLEEGKAAKEVLRIFRGNAWGLTPFGLRCAFRSGGSEGYFHLTIGFRYGYDP